ncbi:MAG: hypothetical protein JO015_09490 [Verrucomicrobia bacterium]|nr:hypothetical protein [Verrucomicrobiota bacterium]
MTDFFAGLRMPARPWLDPDAVKDIYVRLSEALHRQAGSQDELAVLNRAYQVLSNPATRVEHLLSLTGAASGTRRIDPVMGEVFGRVANCLREADLLLGEISVQNSALARALQLQRVHGLQGDLDNLVRELAAQEAQRLEALRELDQVWQHQPADAREALAQVALDLTFLQKWQGQIRERLLRMDEMMG